MDQRDGHNMKKKVQLWDASRQIQFSLDVCIININLQ